MSARNFSPKPGGSQVVAATNVSARVTIPANSTSLLISNDGPGNAFIRIGAGVASPLTDLCLLVGSIMVLDCVPEAGCAVISASTSTLYLSPGMGS